MRVKSEEQFAELCIRSVSWAKCDRGISICNIRTKDCIGVDKTDTC